MNRAIDLNKLISLEERMRGPILKTFSGQIPHKINLKSSIVEELPHPKKLTLSSQQSISSSQSDSSKENSSPTKTLNQKIAQIDPIITLTEIKEEQFNKKPSLIPQPADNKHLVKRRFDENVLLYTPPNVSKKVKAVNYTEPAVPQEDFFGGEMYSESTKNNQSSLSSNKTIKITDFFERVDKQNKCKTVRKLLSNNSSLQEDESSKSLSLATEKMKEYEDKIKSLEKELTKKDDFWKSKLLDFEVRLKDYKSCSKAAVAAQVLENAHYKRIEIRKELNHKKERFGEYISQREGNKFIEIWMDGTEIRNLKDQLEREALEKLLKSSSYPGKTSVSKDLLSDSFFETPAVFIDKDEKERLSNKLFLLSKEENSIKDQLENLENEKYAFYYQLKRQYEEDHSRFGKPSINPQVQPWPILNNNYQLISLLGKGGFSEVYKAYDLENFRYVACKLHQLNPNWSAKAKENYAKHCNRELEVHKNLVHPNIVRLFDSISVDENSFVTVLEYCDGPDLSMYLKKNKILPEQEAKMILRQIISALKYLNEEYNVIHYDVKPQNILFHRGEIKLSDFGLCKIVEDDSSRIELTSQGVGTYWYLPPECFEIGENPPLIDSRVDVWSLGVLFYEILFGMRPFGHGMSQEKILKDNIILKAYTVGFPAKPQVSSEAKEFIKKCLAYKAEDRISIQNCYNSPYFANK